MKLSNYLILTSKHLKKQLWIYQQLIIVCFFKRLPSTVSLRWKALTQTGLRAALWPFLNSCLALRRVSEDGKEANVCFTLLLWFHSLSCFRNPPRVPSPDRHLATDAWLYLFCLFTVSGNVAARLFWRGWAASYLTDLPMKSQPHSISLQRHA